MVGVAQQAAYDATSMLLVLQVVVGLLVTVLAALGYRNNRSRPMLYLATGVALLTFVQFVVSIAMAQFAPVHLVPVGTQTVELVGLLCILYSIVLARSQ